jgi:hypothetical protein
MRRDWDSEESQSEGHHWVRSLESPLSEERREGETRPRDSEKCGGQDHLLRLIICSISYMLIFASEKRTVSPPLLL